MGAKVYANGREILGKAGGGKVSGAFPDVCLSPPQPPAGPKPTPYAVSSKDSDTVDGTKTVKVGGQPVMMKDSSTFKKCTGDEAATSKLGKGVVSHTLKDKVHPISGSGDVIVEGEGVVRHLDLTQSNAHNAAIPMAATKTAAAGGSAAAALAEDCKPILRKYPVESYRTQAPKASAVQAAARKRYDNKAIKYQSHHVLQNSHFEYPRGKPTWKACDGYSEAEAPCIILKGGSNQPQTPHGKITQLQNDDGNRYRARLDPKNAGKVDRAGQNPTFKEVKEDARRQLTAKKPGPAMTPFEADCILGKVEMKIRRLCGGQFKDDLELRAPRQKIAGPNPAGVDGGMA